MSKKLGNIRNLDNFMKSLWPWDIFNKCFGRGIRFSDIDGIVERKGQFLVVEGKSSGAPIPKGQLTMFKEMVATDRFTILILWGNPGEPEEYEVFGKINLPKSKCNSKKIDEFIKGWYNWADRRKRD